MKVIVLLVSLSLLIASSHSESLIASNVRRFMESFRGEMACGVPDLGLPVLAPLNIDRAALNLALGELSINGVATNAYSPDLDTFVVGTINANLLLMRMDFTMTYPWLRVSGNFEDTVGTTPGSCRINGAGTFAVRLRDVSIKMLVRIRLSGFAVQMSSMTTTFSIGGLDADVQNFVGTAAEQTRCNQQLEQNVPKLIKANQATISTKIDAMVRPQANAFLSNMGLSDLLDLVAGGSLGGGSACSRLARLGWTGLVNEEVEVEV